MNDREMARLRRECETHFNWWSEYLGLRHWERHYTWHRLSRGDEHGGYSTTMTCEAYAERLSYNIEVWLPTLYDHVADVDAAERDRRIEKLVVHELMHALVCELRPAEDAEWPAHEFHEERVVAELTNAVIWVANHGHERPRKRAEAKRAVTEARPAAEAAS